MSDDSNGGVKKLQRSRSNRMIGGVCGGIAKHLGLDATVARVLWVIGTFLSVGVGILLYIILLFVIPEEGAV